MRRSRSGRTGARRLGLPERAGARQSAAGVPQGLPAQPHRGRRRRRSRVEPFLRRGLRRKGVSDQGTDRRTGAAGQRRGLRRSGRPGARFHARSLAELRTGHLAARHPFRRAQSQHPPPLRAAAQSAAAPVSLHAHEPDLGRPVPRPAARDVRPRRLRRSVAAHHQQSRRRAGPRPRRRDRRRPEANAAHELFHDQPRRPRGRPRSGRPHQHPRRLSGARHAGDAPALALPQPPRKPDRLQQQPVLREQALHVPVGERPRFEGEFRQDRRHVRPRRFQNQPRRGRSRRGRSDPPRQRSGAAPRKRRRRHLQRLPAESCRRSLRRGPRPGSRAGKMVPGIGGAVVHQKPRERAGRRARRDPVLDRLRRRPRRAREHELRPRQPGRRLAAAQRRRVAFARRDDGVLVAGTRADRPDPHRVRGRGGAESLFAVRAQRLSAAESLRRGNGRAARTRRRRRRDLRAAERTRLRDGAAGRTFQIPRRHRRRRSRSARRIPAGHSARRRRLPRRPHGARARDLPDRRAERPGLDDRAPLDHGLVG